MSDTPSGSESMGTWTRRPSVVATTATRRRSCRSNRPNAASAALFPSGDAVRFAQSSSPRACVNRTRRSRTVPRPGIRTAAGMAAVEVEKTGRQVAPTGSVPAVAGSRVGMRDRCCASSVPPAHPGAEAHRRHCQQCDRGCESRQFCLHVTPRRCDGAPVPATGRSRCRDPWLCVPASRRVCPGRYLKRWTLVVLVMHARWAIEARQWEGSTSTSGVHEREVSGTHR